MWLAFWDFVALFLPPTFIWTSSSYISAVLPSLAQFWFHNQQFLMSVGPVLERSFRWLISRVPVGSNLFPVASLALFLSEQNICRFQRGSHICLSNSAVNTGWEVGWSPESSEFGAMFGAMFISPSLIAPSVHVVSDTALSPRICLATAPNGQGWGCELNWDFLIH